MRIFVRHFLSLDAGNKHVWEGFAYLPASKTVILVSRSSCLGPSVELLQNHNEWQETVL